jgi:hypothetical protein
MKKIFILCLALAALPLLNGCLLFVAGGAAAAGAGTVLYVNGELKDTEPASLDPVHAAALAGLHDMQYVVVNDTKDINNANILARTANDTKIQIQIIKQSASVTEIRIRVGTFGDESLSRQILEKIKAHL